MRLRVIAVGARLGGWVDTAVADYAKRLRGAMPLEIVEIPAASRGREGDATRAMAGEAERILAALTPRDHVVALDERGPQRTTMELAQWLEERRRSGRDLALIIGGPDGLAPAVLDRGAERWSLSKLTLPHGLCRVLLVEQLYRAATVLAGHPYHRP
jgi:23S rRNA (pseudouridine1915-N3)-methyltransferase